MTGMEIVELDWRIRIGGKRLADCFAIRLFCVVGSGRADITFVQKII